MLLIWLVKVCTTCNPPPLTACDIEKNYATYAATAAGRETGGACRQNEKEKGKKLGLKMAVTAPFQGHFSWLHEPYLIEVAELLL